MIRGTGAAPRAAVATPDLHAGGVLAHPDAGKGLSMAAFAAVALAIAWAGFCPGTRAGHCAPGPAGGKR